MTEKKVHRYSLPPVRGSKGREVDSWSVWLVDEATGTLVIFGDRGTWSHTWGHSGRSEDTRRDFRLELLRFDDEYIHNKLAVGVARVFNGEETTRAVRQWIVETRRGRSIGHDRARELWDDVGGLEGESDFTVFLELHDTHGEDLWEFAVFEPHEAEWLSHLCTVTLPRFKAAVRAELFREASRRWFQRQEAAGFDAGQLPYALGIDQRRSPRLLVGG